MRKPAISLAAVPGRRLRTLELVERIESGGFPGIYGPSMSDSLALCTALAFKTKTISFGTTITPIYTRQVQDFAQVASFIHEVSEGRFRFGIGVSHEPAMSRLGITQGKPLSDIRQFVSELKAVPRAGELPPIILATLRTRMIQLAQEIGDGMVFANGARSHMGDSLSVITEENLKGEEFFIGNMIPTCVNDDVQAAAAVNRRTLTSYALLPNYRNYWKDAGYVEEMEGVEACMESNDLDRVPHFLTDRWLSDTTLFGTASQVRDGIEAWFDAGIKTPIIVPSAVTGGQFQAFEEFLGIWD